MIDTFRCLHNGKRLATVYLISMGMETGLFYKHRSANKFVGEAWARGYTENTETSLFTLRGQGISKRKRIARRCVP